MGCAVWNSMLAIGWQCCSHPPQHYSVHVLMMMSFVDRSCDLQIYTCLSGSMTANVVEMSSPGLTDVFRSTNNLGYLTLFPV